MGKSSLGTVLVTGKKRVPSPATGITALRIDMLMQDRRNHTFLCPGKGLGVGLEQDFSRKKNFSLYRGIPIRFKMTKIFGGGYLWQLVPN